MSDSRVLGVVLLVRHGDRQGFYQNPNTYTPSNTVLTPLGNQQEFQLGGRLRQLYLNASSPSYIDGMNTTLVNDAQFRVRADAGGEAGVIMNSALSLLQGLAPATLGSNTTLANGTTITAPLGGYQARTARFPSLPYIPIESVEPANDISLEGWTSCNTFTTATSAFYNSTAFKAKAEEYKSFLASLPPYLDGRPVSLENMWNIYDFMNVQNIHNEAFSKALPESMLKTARYLADWHEYHVFSDPELSGIGNIAGRTIIPSIVDGFESILSSTDPVKFVYHAISYKPFISLFNMTKVAEAAPEVAGIVNYAAAIALEARQPVSGGEPVLRFNFMNGTDNEFKTYSVLGSSSDVPLNDFINYLQPVVVDSLPEWCAACANTKDRGCGTLNSVATSAVAETRPSIGSVGAGFLGAGLMLVVALLMLAMLTFLGCLTLGPGRSKRMRSTKGSFSDKEVKA